MIEVAGDSSRADRWALVRLAVEGDRIVSADAPGLARPLEGLTLLEAAAVPGETPNPCIRCNGSFRFAELLAFARRAGASRLYTGHYARVVRREGRLLLARAADEVKDQSYMLGRLDPALLDRVEFPLGGLTK